jgi:hypothetical protein
MLMADNKGDFAVLKREGRTIRIRLGILGADDSLEMIPNGTNIFYVE